ncbi:MAG: hypothetical protein KC619_00135 [Myxococcales bacterium]|nr:hypothetical protein [Myxococcales bacterium]
MKASPAAIHRLLLDVEELPATEVGALVVERGHGREGAILIEGGRVCWAAAERMPRRLSDLLIGRADGLDAAGLQQIYRRCRSEGRPFGECLVAGGLITADGLRAALLDHTVDALATLAGLPGTKHLWMSRAERSYDPRFTFSTMELATVAAARELDQASRAGSEALQAVLPSGVVGFALFRGGGASRPVLVAHHGADAIGLADVAQLERWATGALDIATAFGPSARWVVANDGQGHAHVGWIERGLVLIAVCDRGAKVAVLLGRLERK